MSLEKEGFAKVKTPEGGGGGQAYSCTPSAPRCRLAALTSSPGKGSGKDSASRSANSIRGVLAGGLNFGFLNGTSIPLEFLPAVCLNGFYFLYINLS